MKNPFSKQLVMTLSATIVVSVLSAAGTVFATRHLLQEKIPDPQTPEVTAKSFSQLSKTVSDLQGTLNGLQRTPSQAQPSANTEFFSEVLAEQYWFDNYLVPRTGQSSVTDVRMPPHSLATISEISLPTTLIKNWSPSVDFSDEKEFSMYFSGISGSVSLGLTMHARDETVDSTNLLAERPSCPEGTPDDVVFVANYFSLYNKVVPSDEICGDIISTSLRGKSFFNTENVFDEPDILVYTLQNTNAREEYDRGENLFYTVNTPSIIIRKQDKELMLKALQEGQYVSINLESRSRTKTSEPLPEAKQIVSLYKELVTNSCGYISCY